MDLYIGFSRFKNVDNDKRVSYDLITIDDLMRWENSKNTFTNKFINTYLFS